MALNYEYVIKEVHPLINIKIGRIAVRWFYLKVGDEEISRLYSKSAAINQVKKLEQLNHQRRYKILPQRIQI